MAEDGQEYATGDKLDADISKLNRKTLLVGTGSQISSTSTTYPGQRAFCTETGSGFVINSLYERNTADDGWTAIKNSHAEQTNTPVTDTANSAGFNGVRSYVFYTLPTTERYYIIHKIEWKNGSVIAGNVMTGIDLVDADPPVRESTPLLGVGNEVAQSGAGVIQATTVNSCKPIPGGSVIGIWISSTSATAQFRYAAGFPDENVGKSHTYTASPPSSHSNTWTTSTLRTYRKIYFRGYP